MVDFILGELSLSGLKNVPYNSYADFKRERLPLDMLLPRNIQHNTTLEIVWTILPCVVLLLIAIPSFSLLYAIEDFCFIDTSIKIIGNQ